MSPLHSKTAESIALAGLWDPVPLLDKAPDWICAGPNCGQDVRPLCLIGVVIEHAGRTFCCIACSDEWMDEAQDEIEQRGKIMTINADTPVSKLDISDPSFEPAVAGSVGGITYSANRPAGIVSGCGYFLDACGWRAR